MPVDFEADTFCIVKADVESGQPFWVAMIVGVEKDPDMGHAVELELHWHSPRQGATVRYGAGAFTQDFMPDGAFVPQVDKLDVDVVYFCFAGLCQGGKLPQSVKRLIHVHADIHWRLA